MKQKITNLLFAFLMVATAKAQQADTTHQIKEVLVTYQANRNTPVTFQNLPAATLVLKNTGQEPAFLLTETPSITAYSDAGNTQGYAYIRMRGIDQTRINMTLDGVPLNEPEDQGAYFSNYPDILNSAGNLQIQRGVGTSKNGVANFGGSIQLFSPDLYDSTRTTFGLGYGSFNSMRAFGEYNSGIRNHKALYVRASQIYSEGYKYHTSNNSQSVFISSGLFYDKSVWKINLLAGQQRNGLGWLGVSDSLLKIDRRTNANSDEDDRFTQCLAQLQNQWQISRSATLQSGVYYTFLKGNYDFDFNNFIGLPSTEELYNYAFLSHLTGFFSNFTFSKNHFNWTTGVHGNRYHRQHTGSEKALGELYVNTGFKQEFSGFTKVDYTIGNFSLFGDLQYRHTAFRYEGGVPMDRLDWQFVNPKAGISYRFNDGSNLYYSVGSTGREPTRNDMFGGNDDLLPDSFGNALLFNTDPEYVTDHELGFRHQSERTQWNVNGYYMDFRNEIVLDGKFGPNGLALTNNVEKSYRTGVEMSLTFQLNNHWQLINHSSFNYSRIKEQRETFRPILTPPVIIFQEVNWRLRGWVFALSGRYQDRSYIDFANSAAIDAYILVNARVHYSIKRYRFSVFANNLTNARYFNNGYVDFDGSSKYFVQAPANFYANLIYQF